MGRYTLDTVKERACLEERILASHILIGCCSCTTAVALFKAILARMVGSIDKTYLPYGHHSVLGIIVSTLIIRFHISLEHCAVVGSIGKLEVLEVLVILILRLNLFFEILGYIRIGLHSPPYIHNYTAWTRNTALAFVV